jgi:hypothetical protein
MHHFKNRNWVTGYPEMEELQGKIKAEVKQERLET